MSYDPESGAFSIRTGEGGEYRETFDLVEPGFGAYVDVDREGRVLGVEFLSFEEFAEAVTRAGGRLVLPDRIPPAEGDAWGGILKEATGADADDVVIISSGGGYPHEGAESAGRWSFFVGALKGGYYYFFGDLADRGTATRATAGARDLARELGVPIEVFRGTGKDGRITTRDVKRGVRMQLHYLQASHHRDRAQSGERPYSWFE